jgi:hypothetical protein
LARPFTAIVTTTASTFTHWRTISLRIAHLLAGVSL